jgi:hypothetical protein
VNVPAGPGPAKFCVECGAPLSVPVPVPRCFSCLDQDSVVAIAQAHHRLALDVLRGKDRAEVIATLAAARDEADAGLAAAQAPLPGLEAAVRAAVAAEREAQDRARAAAEYAAVCAEAERVAGRDKAGPAVRTDARKTAAAAADVAHGECAAQEGAAAAARDAEAALAAARRRVSAAWDAAAAARYAAEHPPAVVPMSEITALIAHPLLAVAQPDAGERERALVSAQVQGAANLCGLTGILRAEGHEAGLRDAEDEAARRPVVVPAPDGHSAMTISPIRRR